MPGASHGGAGRVRGVAGGQGGGRAHGSLPRSRHTCLRQAHPSLWEPCTHFTDEETGTHESLVHMSGPGWEHQGAHACPSLGPNDHTM